MNFLVDETIGHTFDIKELPDYFQESDVIQLKNNIIPKELLSFERLFDSKDVQKAKSLATQNKGNIELEVEPRKSIKVGSECSEEEEGSFFRFIISF